MMKWEAEEKGYTCNDCYLSMQNCHDMSICCEDETGLCDWFEEMPKKEGEQGCIMWTACKDKPDLIRTTATILEYEEAEHEQV